MCQNSREKIFLAETSRDLEMSLNRYVSGPKYSGAEMILDRNVLGPDFPRLKRPNVPEVKCPVDKRASAV